MFRRPSDEAGDALAPDVRDTPWYRVVADIQDLLSGGEYVWATETLGALQATIERTKRVTAGQLRAIDHIRASEWSPGRAYDPAGYRRRWR